MNQTLKAALLLLGLIALAALDTYQESPVVAQTPAPAASPAAQAEPTTPPPQIFHCTQSVVPFTVPPGVIQITVEAHGAHGGSGSGTGSGGQGGLTIATLPVTPGQHLQVSVGCSAHHGSWGYGNGGGSGTADGPSGEDGWSGGGSSAVTPPNSGSALVVAGGGGGGGGHGYTGSGGDGGNGGNPPQNGENGAGGAGGGLGGHQSGPNGSHGTHSTTAADGGGGGGGGGGYHGGDGGHGGGEGGGGGGGGGGGSSWASPTATGVTFGTSSRADLTEEGSGSSLDGEVALSWTVPLTVTSIAPDYGAAGGTRVTITGAGFAPNQQFQTVNGTPFTNEQCSSSTRCTATTPAITVPAGQVIQFRALAVGQATPSSNPFTVYGVPTLSSIGPTSGPAAGGTVVWLTGGIYPNGTNYPGPVPTVRFGNALATAVVCSRSDGTVCGMRSPAGRGTVLVTITTPGGRSTALPFTYTGGTATPPAPTAPVHPRCTPWSGPLALIIPWQNCTG